MMIATSSSFSLGYEWNELEIKRNVFMIIYIYIYKSLEKRKKQNVLYVDYYTSNAHIKNNTSRIYEI